MCIRDRAHSRHKIVQYGLGKLFPDDRFFPTLRAAVSACREELGERWVDSGTRSKTESDGRRCGASVPCCFMSVGALSPSHTFRSVEGYNRLPPGVRGQAPSAWVAEPV